MRKVLALALVLLLVSFTSITYAQNLKKLDEKNGFRGAVLGSDISAFSDMAELENEGQTVIYKRTSDELKVGEYEIESISYSFYKGKLSAIMISTKGYTNSRGLLSILKAQYGAGYQSNRYMEKYSWTGKNVLMSYKENSISNDATVFMFNRPLLEQEQADKKAAAAKAANDI